MLSILLCLSTFLLPFVVCQNQTGNYVVDLGYAKYQGVLNDSFPKQVSTHYISPNCLLTDLAAL